MRRAAVEVGAKEELQFQAIREQIHLGLAHYTPFAADEEIKDKGVTDEYYDLTYFVPSSGDRLYYNQEGVFRAESEERVWTPTLRDTVHNMYDMMRSDPSVDELERMTFKMLRDWRYDTLRVPDGDKPQAGGDLYDFGSLDGREIK